MLTKRYSVWAALLSLLCAVAVTAGSVSAYAQRCDRVRGEVLRLHVLANSDSAEDQNIKLLVRDRLLEVGGALFAQASGAQEAARIAAQLQTELTAAADAVLAEHGCDYRACVEVSKSLFPERTYEDITLPAGVYMAVRVLLGEAQGRNWWCVLFPPLCLPAAVKQESVAAFTDENGTVTQAEGGYEVKLKIVEWFSYWRQKYFPET